MPTTTAQTIATQWATSGSGIERSALIIATLALNAFACVWLADKSCLTIQNGNGNQFRDRNLDVIAAFNDVPSAHELEAVPGHNP